MSNDKMREALEMLNAEEPEYHSQGMGCGLEDRCITDRYEAMSHGWDRAMERVYNGVINPVRDTLNDALSQQPESEPAPGVEAAAQVREYLERARVPGKNNLYCLKPSEIDAMLAGTPSAQVPEGWRIHRASADRIEIWPPGEMPIEVCQEGESFSHKYLYMLCGTLLAAPSIAEKRVCEWTYEPGDWGTFKTGCGKKFVLALEYAGDMDWMEFCSFCGRIWDCEEAQP